MNQSNWRNTDDYVIKTEGGYSLNIVDLFIRIQYIVMMKLRCSYSTNVQDCGIRVQCNIINEEV
jgi:hypothetical protein